jgi:very-short-patch-repair endonuclease
MRGEIQRPSRRDALLVLESMAREASNSSVLGSGRIMGERSDKSEAVRRARRLRREMTMPERRLWGELRNRGVAGEKFRRQAPIGPYIVDFLHISSRLVVELDGRSHDDRFAYDDARQKWLESRGFRVLRIANDDVLDDSEAVVAAILSAVSASRLGP